MAKKSKAKVSPVTLNITPEQFVDLARKQEDNFLGGMINGMDQLKVMDGMFAQEFGGASFAGAMMVQQLIMMESRLLRGMTAKLDPKMAQIFKEEKVRYVQARAQIEKALGTEFQTAYGQGRATHNQCAAHNGTEQLPVFNADGTFKVN